MQARMRGLSVIASAVYRRSTDVLVVALVIWGLSELFHPPPPPIASIVRRDAMIYLVLRLTLGCVVVIAGLLAAHYHMDRAIRRGPTRRGRGN
jgi:hypothetical protein